LSPIPLNSLRGMGRVQHISFSLLFFPPLLCAWKSNCAGQSNNQKVSSLFSEKRSVRVSVSNRPSGSHPFLASVANLNFFPSQSLRDRTQHALKLSFAFPFNTTPSEVILFCIDCTVSFPSRRRSDRPAGFPNDLFTAFRRVSNVRSPLTSV